MTDRLATIHNVTDDGDRPTQCHCTNSATVLSIRST